MKGFSFYLKATILSVILFVASLLLLNILFYFVDSQEYLTPSFSLMASVTSLQLAVILTAALLAGCWDKWEQYVFTPLPIMVAVFMTTFRFNSSYAVIFMLAMYVIMAYDLLLANQLKKQMLVFNPRLILKFTTKGTLLVFSLSAAAFVILNTVDKPPMNLGWEAGKLIDRYITPSINKSLSEQFGLVDIQELGVTQEQLELAEEYGFLDDLEKVEAPQLSLKDTVSAELNQAVEPYKRFINPVMALLVFGLVHFLGLIAYFIYTIIIDLVFFIAKRTGLFIIEKVPAEKEVLHF